MGTISTVDSILSHFQLEYCILFITFFFFNCALSNKPSLHKYVLDSETGCWWRYGKWGDGILAHIRAWISGLFCEFWELFSNFFWHFGNYLNIFAIFLGISSSRNFFGNWFLNLDPATHIYYLVHKNWIISAVCQLFKVFFFFFFTISWCQSTYPLFQVYRWIFFAHYEFYFF